MNKESHFLKKRAKEFWERAKEDLKKQRYNLCALDVEQTVQLLVKYLIFLKSGDFPKTHQINILIDSLAEIYNSSKFQDFYKTNILQFKSLEDSYLTSRYLPREFSKDEALKFIELAVAFFKVAEEIVHEKLI